MTYELHPLCTLFPRITGADYAALCQDIKAHGLREPIVLHDDMVLDGGNRYRACLEAGVEPAFTQFDGVDVVAFVLSANLHRRHLTAGQHVAIVASITNWASAQGHGGDRRSDQGATLHLETVADRVAASGASVRTQKMADKVAKADPALAREVAQGTTTLRQAVARVEGCPALPPAAPAPVLEDDDGPSAEEIAEAEAAARDDAERIRLLLDSDDALAAMTAKCEMQAALIRALEAQKRELMNGKNEAIKQAKAWQRKFERLERECAA